MKKILLLFAICTVCSCETPQEKNEQTKVQTKVQTGVRRGGIVEEVEIKGHIYLIFNGSYKGNIIHAEHCPCRK